MNISMQHQPKLREDRDVIAEINSSSRKEQGNPRFRHITRYALGGLAIAGALFIVSNEREFTPTEVESVYFNRGDTATSVSQRLDDVYTDIKTVEVRNGLQKAFQDENKLIPEGSRGFIGFNEAQDRFIVYTDVNDIPEGVEIVHKVED